MPTNPEPASGGMDPASFTGPAPAPATAPVPASAPAALPNAAVDPAAHSKLAAALLAFFFGLFGAHRFYLGYTRRALIMLSITIVGGILTLGLAALAVQFFSWYEAIMYLTGQPRFTTDAAGRPLRG